MHALTYKGVDTSIAAYDLNVTRAEIDHIAPARLDVLERSVRDGAIVQAATLGPLRCQCEAVVGREDADPDLLDEQLLRIAKLLDPRAGAGWLHVRDRENRTASPRRYWAILDGPLSSPQYSDHVAVLRFTFLIPDGKATSLVPDTESYAIDADPKTFHVPNSSLEIVGGNSGAFPVWIFENTDAATLNSFTLENKTTGKLFRWGTVSAGNLATNDLLRIDTKLERVEKSVDAGANWTNELYHVGLGDPLPLLVDGVRNEFEMAGVVAGTLGVSYDREYLS